MPVKSPTATKAKLKKPAKSLTMNDLLAETPPKPLEAGDIAEATVITVSRNEAWLDLGMQGAGLVARREINPSLHMKPGDSVTVSVIDPESHLGYPILSLKKVAKEKGWDYLQKMMDEGEIITVEPTDANRGGLLVEVEGIRGFLPVSQLSAQHYPRVSNADRDEILQKLNELKRQPLKVRILDIDRDQSKLIVSEKEAMREHTREKLGKLKVGDAVEGVVTGGVDFGIFVTVEGIEGLVHISEISWDRITNPASLYKPGDKVKAKIIAIEEEKLSLSIKQLSQDPWLEQSKQFKAGDSVEGVITRITPFGAFIQITPVVEALVHVSELAGDKKPEMPTTFAVGQKHSFKILDIDPSARKISLTMKSAKSAKATKTAKTTKVAKPEPATKKSQ